MLNETDADTKYAPIATQTTANANKEAIDKLNGTAVESRLPRPTDACADPKNKCVLVSAGKGNYTWEVIERGTSEVSGN